MAPVTGAAPPAATGFDGTQTSPYAGNYPPVANSSTRVLDVILRFIVVVTALIATIVMAVTKQTKLVEIDGDFYILRLKTTGASQFNVFIAANAIAFVYGLVSLVLTIVNRAPSAKGSKLVLTIVDVLLVGFIFAAIGSASAFAVLLRKGDGDGYLYPKVCHVYGKFCTGLAGAIVMSSVSGLALIALVLFAVVGLHQSSA